MINNSFPLHPTPPQKNHKTILIYSIVYWLNKRYSCSNIENPGVSLFGGCLYLPVALLLCFICSICNLLYFKNMPPRQPSLARHPADVHRLPMPSFLKEVPDESNYLYHKLSWHFWSFSWAQLGLSMSTLLGMLLLEYLQGTVFKVLTAKCPTRQIAILCGTDVLPSHSKLQQKETGSYHS